MSVNLELESFCAKERLEAEAARASIYHHQQTIIGDNQDKLKKINKNDNHSD